MNFRLIITLLFLLTNFKVMADPFTNEIGLIKEPEIIETPPEENLAEVEEDIVEETIEVVEEDIFTSEPEEVEVVKVVEVEPEVAEIQTIINFDPMLQYPLTNYILKGTALSQESSVKFERAKIKKFDRAKIPTTHTIKDGETIEKIAFRYGFSLREIELANAIYPGSRTLVSGDKLVIPNRFHIVKEGQSLTSIADRYKINATQLASYNDVGEDEILLIGEKLHLPFFIHVTYESETLSDIAGRYEREVDELISFNNFNEDTLVINENQLIKIPIYANQKIDYANLDKKSINDFKIDKKNLAIIQINDGQYMVREGDRIANKEGVIVSIQKNMMIVLEDNIEYQFYINTPIVGQAIASLPSIDNEIIDVDTNDVGTSETDESSSNDDQSNNNDSGTITNPEDLFN